MVPHPESARIHDAAEARQWWSRRRLVYNAVLVAAGMASLTVQAAILELTKCEISELDLTPMTLVYRAAGYLAAMGVANLAYSLAPLAEHWWNPSRVDAFRQWTFGLGLAVSFALPFLFLAKCKGN
jgi:hypothetical protein